jgi:hypothetical protein
VLEFLARRGFTEAEARRFNRIARGHPLTLSLASQLTAGMPAKADSLRVSGVLERLAQLYLSDATPTARAGVEASSVLRRVTQPLLAALLPDSDAAQLWEELSCIPFFETSRDGLYLHDAVREAVASSLRTRDPVRFAEYRRAAWRSLHAGSSMAKPGQRSRVTLDLIFLLDHPGVREAFFPSSASPLSIEPAAAGHGAVIESIAHRHETPEALETLRHWWKQHPAAFRIARNPEGVAGFYVFLDDSRVTPELQRADPVVRYWAEHLRDEPLARGQAAILIRRWLSADAGEAPSAVQAECWLDVKRTYLEMRASLRRCYIVVSDLGPYGEAARSLGFTVLAQTAVFGNAPQHLAVLDFGPGSLDGWIGGLIAGELDAPDGEILDRRARQVCVDGDRIGLTALEFGVFSLLRQQEGKAVSRDELLAEVWGRRFDAGSNVVDVVVRSLRRKLGSQAALLTTVRGVGYRFGN